MLSGKTSALSCSPQESVASRPKTIQPRSGVKVEPVMHGANTMTFNINSYLHPTTSAKELLKTSCKQEVNKMKNDNLIETSSDDISEAEPFLPPNNRQLASYMFRETTPSRVDRLLIPNFRRL